jgi:hypothetical protein
MHNYLTAKLWSGWPSQDGKVAPGHHKKDIVICLLEALFFFLGVILIPCDRDVISQSCPWNPRWLQEKETQSRGDRCKKDPEM